MKPFRICIVAILTSHHFTVLTFLTSPSIRRHLLNERCHQYKTYQLVDQLTGEVGEVFDPAKVVEKWNVEPQVQTRN